MSNSHERVETATHDNMLECRGLTRVYQEGPQDLTVLDNLELTVAAGERIAVVGSSGSGKTTLLNLLGGLDRPTQGEILIGGRSIKGLSEAAIGKFRNQHIGFVYQFHHLLAEFTALENVSMPLIIRGQSRSEAAKKANILLERVGMAPRGEHKPGELSGGERQRVAIARALVTDPSLVLMDEPTGNLDQTTARQILDLMDEVAERSRSAFVVVTHDMAIARHQDRVLRLDKGRLAPDTTG
ncbi:lipoprotein-releasing system ATP-binding protein LolD [Kushneria pakistanensis]|uniref:Lipoprotein-releasing system ATP-binding protein LolD n=1 Tax=Kushneria pakistanensis TaxID=1508770 RepID=A0ABQ3FCZ1_9GAMM|nr:lipoprotein-releasing ABC transporter ATP-binding protein LolD [Kushneria pakistanensis]GHC19128.1 lipoprotein-releasing system ATP-binding protein LolD [Kushneria pakistanensis]